jgi:hypothetical protein
MARRTKRYQRRRTAAAGRIQKVRQALRAGDCDRALNAFKRAEMEGDFVHTKMSNAAGRRGTRTILVKAYAACLARQGQRSYLTGARRRKHR